MKKKIGATGKYPEGSLGPHDEGELSFTIATDSKGLVHIHFGTPVAWIGLRPEQAIELGKLLLMKAGAKKVEVEL
jgi:hypothetical protein